MADNWEDWDSEDFVIPIFNTRPNVKQLEERKLVEESDNALTNDLFGNIKKTNVNKNLLNNNENLPKNVKTKTISNQKINEEKQKEKSKFIKKQKENIIKIKELYGVSVYQDEYSHYEDKFYNN